MNENPGRVRMVRSRLRTSSRQYFPGTRRVSAREHSRGETLNEPPALRDEQAAHRTGSFQLCRFLTTDPPWWIRDVLIALLIGGLLLVSQSRLDDVRDQRVQRLEEQRIRAAERLENLRFVRERSASGQLPRPFSGLDLAGLDLRGLELSAADFTDADLTDAFLSQADLSQAELSGADLSGADLSGAGLSRAFLAGADLSGADLSQADLGGAALSDADLTGADLTNAFLSGAFLNGADLSGADLTGATVRQTCFTSATKWPEGFSVPPPAPRCS